MLKRWSSQWFSQFIRPMTLRHHLVTMTNGESLAKTNQRTINALIAFLVWIVFFHSTSCNSFIFGVQASWRSPKTLSKTIQLTNNCPATTTSSFLQLPNEVPAHLEQLWVPTTTASTGIQVDNDRLSTLNDTTTPSSTASTGIRANNGCGARLCASKTCKK